MRYYLNDEAIQADLSNIQVTDLGDRFVVKTTGSDGSVTTRTGVAIREGDKVLISFDGIQVQLDTRLHRARASAGVDSGELRAPMPGQIVDVLVEEGQAVAKGQKVAVLEAMKTQQPFLAPFDGLVHKILSNRGDQVADGQVVVVIVKE